MQPVKLVAWYIVNLSKARFPDKLVKAIANQNLTSIRAQNAT
ncbi:MAG: hypothetical protein SAJ37_20435 [Oscillatoria sp. PMC 1068.18]|nr:hypothetical protein [Oscillatoria sp. PMC 1076.18]MEC4991108.1 hypothetical protein [Oscillatoria sp. PMC 1068.18]